MKRTTDKGIREKKLKKDWRGGSDRNWKEGSEKDWREIGERLAKKGLEKRTGKGI